MIRAREALRLMKEAASSWSADYAPSMGAALAYYTMFSLAPTLLIVGGEDTEILALNRAARRWLNADSDLAIVPGATHLFEEPGTLEEVARLAAVWFVDYL